MLRTAAMDYARAKREGVVDWKFYPLDELPSNVWNVDPMVDGPYSHFHNLSFRGVVVQEVSRAWIAVYSTAQDEAELFRLSDLT